MPEQETSRDKSEEQRSPLPTPTLPKGGGAIRDIGEKFTANPASGTGSVSVPIFTSPGRGGFHPELTLNYDSGSGNGPFGVGWNLSIPSISRKTDKGLPLYRDAEDSDVFILSGAEDLVPSLKKQGNAWLRDVFDATLNGQSYHVERFRPRVEAAFARVERWARSDGDVFWRAITRDNITSTYGTTADSRVADRDDSQKVFRWLLDETRDSKGNIIKYVYKPEDSVGAPSIISESNRRSVNRYLKRIFYGNKKPNDGSAFHFQVVFDYGEHSSDTADDIPGLTPAWTTRIDPFSTYRSTFEIRTYRLCQRVLMFHQFPELDVSPDAWVLVRSTDFAYKPDPVLTKLIAVTQTGYDRNNLAVPKKSLPPIELAYTEVEVHSEMQVLDNVSAENIPGGVEGGRHRFLDYDSEGLPGILSEIEPGAWFYKRNLGKGQFGPFERISRLPLAGQFFAGLQELTDLAGDGLKYLVQYRPPIQGYFERTEEGAWGEFIPFSSIANLEWSDSNLRFVDLDGDGLADLLITEQDVLRWHRSRGKEGFGPENDVRRPREEEKGPILLFADSTETAFLADMSGDGLSDIVRVRNGEVTYWPNLGYGRFGGKITLARSPNFDTIDQFDPRRIRLADVDGSGNNDVIYIGRREIKIWFNEAGNALSANPTVLANLPIVDNSDGMSVLDILGSGTAALVFSTALPRAKPSPVHYVDLMGGRKPHLLREIKNNLGLTTTITYAPSTKFYLQDRKGGAPWVTKLPFPVQVVEQVEVQESVTSTRLVTNYYYHHGHYDGIEREFAGFGVVEQQDAEAFAGEGTAPALTRTWFHTGAWFDEETIARQYVHEYWGEDAGAALLPDSIIPPGLDSSETRQAARALRGHMLRQEIYGLDGDEERQPRPYRVLEQSFEVRQIQPQGEQRFSVVNVRPREAITYNYERQTDDPRVTHDFTLEVDLFDFVRKQVSIAYPRRAGGAKQDKPLATLSEHDYEHETVSYYRLGLPTETRSFELLAVASPAGKIYTSTEALGFAANRRLFERTSYEYADAERALLRQTRRLAFTPDVLAPFGGRVTSAMLTDAGYVKNGTSWGASSGTTEYGATHFYQPVKFIDAFGKNVSTVIYDGYELFVTEVRIGVGTPLETVITAGHDYRALQPSLLTDVNGNPTRAMYDIFWRVGSTVLKADSPDHPTTRIEYHLESTPAWVYLEARERHFGDDPNSPFQRTWVYSDGLGREVLKKVQAKPGDDSKPRYVGSGRLVYDNKGNPVRKYEPYFSPTPDYEVVFHGVTDVLTYDPLGRVIRTLHPNGSYTRVEFDAWKQITWDENDSVGDTGNAWARAMAGGTAEQQDALSKALVHADTPTTVRLDPLGRGTITEQLLVKTGQPLATKLTLDIQSNTLVIEDPRQNQVAIQNFDLLKRKIHTVSVDAGESWLLPDAYGNQCHGWDPRGYVFERRYDELRRSTHLFVTFQAVTILAERMFWGELAPNPASTNHRGRIWKQLDSAGVLVHDDYDFKGNPTTITRRLARKYDSTPAWDDTNFEPQLETEAFSIRATFDALNRLVSRTTPDGSVTARTYGEGGLLETLSAQGDTIIASIDYNEKAQRKKLIYGNGIRTEYDYEKDTFRLKSIQSFRGAATKPELQALSYTYDPVGNITQIHDDAQQGVFFANNFVDATNVYTYDALYRLSRATGREHASQSNADQTRSPVPGVLLNPNDAQAMRRYSESYQYDVSGNISEMKHQYQSQMGLQTAWTRKYDYFATSNRLRSTTLPSGTTNYPSDSAGNITDMAGTQLDWNHRGRLWHAHPGSVDMYFSYDIGGQRVRKLAADTRTKERIYLGGYEVYRERQNESVSLERLTLDLQDDRGRIALIETLSQGDDGTPKRVIRYQLSNHLGSAQMELDGPTSAKVLSYEEYHPYGTTAYQARNPNIVVSEKRYRYTSKERDDQTGLSYHGARYYVSWLGRWASVDPVFSSSPKTDRFNGYAFTHLNPLSYVDLSGLSSFTVDERSKISAAGLVKMIREDKHVPSWIRQAFTSSGNKINFDQTAKPPKTAPVWERDLFKSLAAVSGAESFRITTATLFITPQQTNKENQILVPDTSVKLPPIVRERQRNDKSVTTGITLQPEQAFEDIRSSPFLREKFQAFDLKPLSVPGKSGLVIVANQIEDRLSGDLAGKLSDQSIVKTLFHELSIHAAGPIQGIPWEHEPSDRAWRPGEQQRGGLPRELWEQIYQPVNTFARTLEEHLYPRQ